MKIERSKNAARNISYRIPLNIYSLILPFITKTIFIRIMGMEYLGLGSLFSSILSVLNLAELGVGSAMTFSMYKPIAEDNTKKICALMKLYKLYYRIIGGVILLIGLILTPFIPKLISGDVPNNINIYLLYFMHLSITVLTYWLFAYKNCLIYAHQRDDIIAKISFFILTATNLSQLLVIYYTKNYYYYVLVSMITGVLSNLVTAVIVDKKFPNYHAVGKLQKSEIKIINKRVRDLFTAKLGSTIINSADSIVISSFLGLKILAMYNNYYYIMTSIQSFISIILTSCAAGIGNSLVIETKEKNFNDLKKITLLISWISCFCVCCFSCIYQPFMELWVGKSNVLPNSFVFLFCTYFYFGVFTTILFQYKDAAGIWKSDKYRVLVSSVSNLVMNIIMVNYWELYGILLSTIISTVFISVPWLFHNLFKEVFDKKCLKPYLKKIISYLILTVICSALCILISNLFLMFESLILTIICRGIMCCIIPNVIWFLIFRKSNEISQLIIMINVITKGKFCMFNKLIK